MTRIETTGGDFIYGKIAKAGRVTLQISQEYRTDSRGERVEGAATVTILQMAIKEIR